MKLRHLLTITSSILVLSCQKENNKEVGTIANNDTPITSTQQANPAVATSKQVMLNPPHGEPNHRCDLEVGAPLDGSTPTTSITQPVAPQPVPAQFNTNPINTSPVPTVNNTGAKPSINPPHGEPHHRCDLEVGAPLI